MFSAGQPIFNSTVTKERKLIEICYIYVGRLEKGILRPGFHSVYRKYPQRLTHILKRIVNRGHKVFPVTIESCFGERSNPYIGYGLGACSSLLGAVRTRANIFLADYLEAGVLAYICRKTLGSFFVFDFRDNYAELAEYGITSRSVLRDHYISRLEKSIPNLADKVIVVSEDLRNRCLSFGVDDKKIVTIPHGVDTNMFSPLINGEKTRKEFNLSNPTIVFIGKMEPYYHLDVLIEAFSFIVKEEPLSKFLLVGDGRDINNLRTLSKKLGILDSVIFAGFQSHARLPQFINAADLAVFPHYSGLAVYEYMACGKPIVKLRAKRGDVLEHMKDGFLVKERTPEEFARGIIRVLADKQFSEKMGRNARRLAVKNHSWELIAEKYLNILQDLACNAG